MDKKEIRSSNILFLLKCLLFSYILTGGFLLLLALFLYKFQLSEKVVSIAIIGIYVVAVFFAGFMTGKRMGSKKFLWGLAVGLAYFAVMALVSFAANHGFGDTFFHHAGHMRRGGNAGRNAQLEAPGRPEKACFRVYTFLIKILSLNKKL